MHFNSKKLPSQSIYLSYSIQLWMFILSSTTYSKSSTVCYNKFYFWTAVKLLWKFENSYHFRKPVRNINYYYFHWICFVFFRRDKLTLRSILDTKDEERDHIYKLNCDEVQVLHELKDAHQFILSYEVKNTLKFATFYWRADFRKTGYWF